MIAGTEREFLTAIVANPDDDQLRQDYIEWLREPERAVTRDAMADYLENPAAADLTERVVRQFIQYWTVPEGVLLSPDCDPSLTENGFPRINVIFTSADHVIRHVGDIASFVPNLDVHLPDDDRENTIHAMLEALPLNVKRLTIYGANDAAIEQLASHPGLARITELSIQGDNFREHAKLTDKGIRALALSPYARQLEILDVSGNKLGDESAASLAGSPNFANLEVLLIGKNMITPAGARRLVGLPTDEQQGRPSYNDTLRVLTLTAYRKDLQPADYEAFRDNSELLPNLKLLYNDGYYPMDNRPKRAAKGVAPTPNPEN